MHALERQLADIRHSIARERRAIPQAGCYLVSQGSGWQHSNSVQCTHCRCRCRRCWRPPAVRCSTCSISQRTCRPTCQHLSQAASRGLAKQMQPMLRHRLRHPLRAEKTATPMCQPLRPQRRGNARKPPEGQAAHCTGCAGQRVCHHSLRQPGPVLHVLPCLQSQGRSLRHSTASTMCSGAGCVQAAPVYQQSGYRLGADVLHVLLCLQVCFLQRAEHAFVLHGRQAHIGQDQCCAGGAGWHG